MLLSHDHTFGIIKAPVHNLTMCNSSFIFPSTTTFDPNLKFSFKMDWFGRAIVETQS